MAQCRRYAYAIVGHSGESAAIPFVDFGNAPSNRKERLKARRTACARTAIAVLVEYSPNERTSAAIASALGLSAAGQTTSLTRSAAGLVRLALRQVLLKMHAHSQYCASGDTTLEAAAAAVKAPLPSPSLSHTSLSTHARVHTHRLGYAVAAAPCRC